MRFVDVADDSTLDLVSTTRPGVVREFSGLWILTRSRWSRGARPWLGMATALATALVALFLHFHILRPELWRSGAVYAALPLTTELTRLPMSFFFPTAYLPLWAACAQLLVVIGLGEMILGRSLTIVVALVGHCGSTLMARILLSTVHSHVFGLVPALVHVLDTGPSAATTAVGACLLVATRMNRSALLLSVVLITAALIMPGVDGFEHTTALIVGVAAGALDCAVITRLSATRDKLSYGGWSARLAWPLRISHSVRRVLAGLLVHAHAR
jgi:hypothetical protein